MCTGGATDITLSQTSTRFPNLVGCSNPAGMCTELADFSQEVGLHLATIQSPVHGTLYACGYMVVSSVVTHSRHRNTLSVSVYEVSEGFETVCMTGKNYFSTTVNL